MLDFIKKIIEFLTGSLHNLQITVFGNNKKIENKIDESFVSGPVQQAKIINNTYNNLQDNKEKATADGNDLSKEETRAEELRIQQNRKQIREDNDYSCL